MRCLPAVAIAAVMFSMPVDGVEGQLLNMPLPALPENQEILVSEVLARVWVAMMSGHQYFHAFEEMEAVAQNVYTHQIEARNRALHLILLAEERDEFHVLVCPRGLPATSWFLWWDFPFLANEHDVVSFTVRPVLDTAGSLDR